MSKLRTLFFALACLCAPLLVQAGQLDINHATPEQIAATMKGVGINKAKAIVAYRDAHGPFKSVDELVNVKGIGSKTVAANRDKLILEVPAK